VAREGEFNSAAVPDAESLGGRARPSKSSGCEGAVGEEDERAQIWAERAGAVECEHDDVDPEDEAEQPAAGAGLFEQDAEVRRCLPSQHLFAGW
jgi:hypothetical protein